MQKQQQGNDGKHYGKEVKEFTIIGNKHRGNMKIEWEQHRKHFGYFG